LGRHDDRQWASHAHGVGALAECERQLIRARTDEGRARAKAQGVRLGRKPTLTRHQQRSDQAPRSWRGDACGDWAILQCVRLDDFEARAMTVKQTHVRTADRAFQTLEQLTKEGYACFRGHRDARWRLESALARHRKVPPTPRTTHEIDEMINHFIVNLASIGIPLPFDKRDRRGRLEFARHYGVPSPLIDFSLSPYVALRGRHSEIRRYASKLKSQNAASAWCIPL
jgi:FRG domain